MKLSKIIDNIDKSSLNESYVSDYGMFELFGLDYYTANVELSRITAYFYCKWICTDSWVGGRAYFLDGVFVATSWQQNRKGDEDFKWVSQESYTKVKNYLLSLCGASPDVFETVDLEEEMGYGYRVQYGEELLTKEVLYNGKLVEVTKTWRTMDDVKKWSMIEINDDGELKTIHVGEFLVPYNIKK